MATKLQNISELARQTTERLTQSIDNWKRFLDSAAWLYKYPFHEQVLIHAQRPDAKACAPIELWNRKFRRWVNRGAKGIAIIDDSGHKPALRYVFDVSDTNTRYNIPFRLWQTKSQYTAQIIEELQNHFGDTGAENANMAATVLGISINAVSDNYRDYYEELLKAADNSALADMSDDEISSTFVLQLMTSVSHTVLVRLGIDPAAIFHGDEYESIRLFNSLDTIAQLGTATSDISEMILRQIERSVRSMERQERGTLANVEPVLQNEGRNSERSDENGTRLQAERGLPDSRYQNGRSADGDDRQIRQNAEDVSQGASERDLQLPAASEQADGASVGDRQDGAGTGRTDDGADGADRERDREDESRESDALDSANEQHSAESRGDGIERSDPRITAQGSLFPTLEEQIQHIEEAEAQKLTAFSVSQADIDNELCRHGSGFSQGKFRIHTFYQEEPTAEDAIKFLKKEYGIGGHSHTYLDGSNGFVDHDSKGIHFSNRHYRDKRTIPWKNIERRLRELIALDRYLTEKEKAYLPTYEQEQVERRLQQAEETVAREALRAAAAAMDETRKSAEYRFSLGDEVQLGAQTYTILGYDDETVMLSNPKYPLLYEDMPREVFERRLRESEANDHLIQVEMPKETEGSPYQYAVGDTVYLDDAAFRITQITDNEVQLLDPTLIYPIFRAESRETFHHMLEQDERNAGHIIGMPYRTITQLNLREDAAPKEQGSSDMEQLERDEALRMFDEGEIVYLYDAEGESEDIAETREDIEPFSGTIAMDRDTDESQPEQPLVPAWEQPKGPKLKNIIIDLTQPCAEKYDFHITDDALGYGGPKAKYQMNVAAIRTLQNIEAEHRLATPEEQEILSHYVGWGGCADAFDETKENWRAEYAELKGLLTEEEYESARSSTLNAHYTTPTVIKAIYKCIEDMGFTTGNVLDEAVA